MSLCGSHSTAGVTAAVDGTSAGIIVGATAVITEEIFTDATDVALDGVCNESTASVTDVKSRYH